MKYAIYLTVYTDHANLLYLCNNDRLSARATSCVPKLSAFKMRIVHKPGKDNVGPDAISRLQREVAVISTKQPYDHSRIARLQREDRELSQLINFLETGEPYHFPVPYDIAEDKATDFFLDETGILYKLTVPEKPYHAAKLLVVPTELRQEIMLHCHDHPVAGHMGLAKTLSRISIEYW